MKTFLYYFLSAWVFFIPLESYANVVKAVSNSGGGGGGNPGGSSGQIQINNGSGGFGALTNPAAYSQISSYLQVDPRSTGASCSGAWYSITGSSLVSGGTGYNVGDTFIMEDNGGGFGAHVRGGKNATGTVTSAPGGVVTGYTLNYAGTGYYSGNTITPYASSGTGSGLQISITSVNSIPTNPTVTLNSGGENWAVGDVFYIPNGSSTNLMTGRVASVTTGGVVATFTINNPGGDYSTGTALPATAFNGLGTGLLINITSVSGNASNGTFDDTYGFLAASTVSSAFGGQVIVPDGCWVNNLMPVNGTTYIGAGWAPNYGYGDAEVSGDFLKVSGGPHLFIFGIPNFGIDFNNQAQLAFVGFEVRAYASAAFGDTACLGSFHGGGGFDSSGITEARISINSMSAKGCAAGVGTYNGTGSFLFVNSQYSDYGGNQNGIYGPFSDLVSIGDTIASDTTAVWLTTSAGGFGRIENMRTEYNTTQIELDSGGLQMSLVNWQADRSSKCALYMNGTSQVNITGGALKGAGLEGTLTVTGTQSNGGLIELTVSGYGNNVNGGATPTSGLVTGDVADVSGVLGTTEANGRWTITVTDSTHITLQGSTYVNAWISGGTQIAGVEGKEAYICMNGSSNLSTSNVGFFGASAGSDLAAASIIDATGSTNITMRGGQANLGNSATGGYRQTFANWHSSSATAPANVDIDVPGTAIFRNDQSTFSFNKQGGMGLGTSTPNQYAALDMSALTSAMILPTGTTAQEPTPTAGMLRYNSSLPGLEAYYNSTWNALATGGFVSPANGSVIVSNGTSAPTGVAEVDGDVLCGQSGAWTTCTNSSNTNALYRDIAATFDGGGNAIVAGKTVYVANIPYAGNITGWTMIADQTCSAVVDVWVNTAGNVPTVSQTITASALPTLSSAQIGSSTTLTGWTPAIAKGDTLAFHLNSASTCTFLNISLQFTVN